MTYVKQTFENGKVLNDSDLNQMSQGIADNLQILQTGYLGTPTQVDVVWEVGAINSQNGEAVAMSTRIRTDFIKIEEDLNVQVGGTGAEFCPTYYDDSKVFISCPGVYQVSDLTISPSMCSYVRIMVRDKANTNNTLSASYGQNVSIMTGGQRMIYTAAEIDTKFGAGATSGLSGKKIVFLGDSIPHGQTTSGSIEIPYPQVVAKNLGMTLKNYGIGGSTIAQQENYGGAFKTKAELDAATKDTSKYYQVINGQSYSTYGYSNGS